MIKTNLFIKFILLLSLLLATAGQAAAATNDGLVAIPPLKALVTDLTGTLTPQQVNELDATLKNFEKASGSQIAVLIVPTTKPEEIEQYSIRVVDQWKLGRKKIDDGILLLVAKDDRKVRIDVGYGLEGAVPDVIAKRIIEEIIIPSFKNGDYYGGINAGVNTLIKIIGGEPLPAPKEAVTGKISKITDSTDTWIYLLFIAAGIGIFFQKIFGKLLGSTIVSVIVGLVAWFFLGVIIAAVIVGIVAFILMLWVGSDGGKYGGGGWGGGGSSWGGGGGSSWGGGGGGGFGGGGASGSW